MHHNVGIGSIMYYVLSIVALRTPPLPVFREITSPPVCCVEWWEILIVKYLAVWRKNISSNFATRGCDSDHVKYLAMVNIGSIDLASRLIAMIHQ